ncbi:YfhO family protein [Membranihabitans marinus]|uniref:YfhO family protein n=1 Tax=Membranihabitans marinus TaxID=1227546 RepID=UPI001F3F8920|nr:YfhO family protein [Membranihabitans marinus]
MKFVENFLLIILSFFFYGFCIWWIAVPLSAFPALGIWSFTNFTSLNHILSPPYNLPLWLPMSDHGLPLFLDPSSWNPLVLWASRLSSSLSISTLVIYLTSLAGLSTIWIYISLRLSELSRPSLLTIIIAYALLSMTVLNTGNINIFISFLILPIWVHTIYQYLKHSNILHLWILAGITFIASVTLSYYPIILCILLLFCLYKIYKEDQTLSIQRALFVLLFASLFYGWLIYESLIYYQSISPNANWSEIVRTLLKTELDRLDTTTFFTILIFLSVFLIIFFKKNKISFDKKISLRQQIYITTIIILIWGITTLTNSHISISQHLTTDVKNQNNALGCTIDTTTTKDHIPFFQPIQILEIEEQLLPKSFPVSNNSFPLIYYSADPITNLPHVSFHGDSFKINQFIPFRQLSFETEAHKTQKIIFNQPYSPHWQVNIDKKRSQIHVDTNNRMEINIKPGQHYIEFNYWPGGLINLYLTSIALLFLVSLYLGLRSFKKYGLYYILLTILLIITLYPIKPSSVNAITVENDAIDTLSWNMNYEYPNPNWKLNTGHLDIEKSKNGFRSERLNKDQIYSATLAIPFKRNYSGKKLIYQFDVLTATDVKFAVVLVVKKDNLDQHQIQYLETFGREDWSSISGHFDLPMDSSTVDSLAFYIWNYEKNELRMDDIKTEIKE